MWKSCNIKMLIEQSSDVKELVRIREDLKDRVVEPMHWKDRIELYKQIQLIHEKVRNLLDN